MQSTARRLGIDPNIANSLYARYGRTMQAKALCGLLGTTPEALRSDANKITRRRAKRLTGPAKGQNGAVHKIPPAQAAVGINILRKEHEHMEDRSTGMSWIAVLFVIIVVVAIFGGNLGGGWGWNRSGNPYPAQEGGCNRVSNCQVEKQGIVDAARTQYLIEQQSNNTRAAINASTEAITSQASRIYEQRLQETIYDLKTENQSLKNSIFTKEQTDALAAKISDCCCGFNRRLDAIECRMLTKPTLYGVAATGAGQIIPATCGCNGSTNL